MADLNQNPWVAAGAANQTLLGSALDMFKLFLMGYGAYTLVKKAGSFIGGFFTTKEVPVETISRGEPELEEEVEYPGSPEVLRVNPSRRRRRVIRRKRRA